MYCRNCGEQLNDQACVCVKCGVMAGSGVSFCPNCGSKTDPLAAVCTNCGVDFAQYTQVDDPAQMKSKVAAGLLGIFLGVFGVHNFYLGYTGKAVAQLLITLVSCFTLFWISSIWGLIEGILILVGTISTDSKGVPLKS